MTRRDNFRLMVADADDCLREMGRVVDYATGELSGATPPTNPMRRTADWVAYAAHELHKLHRIGWPGDDI